MTVNLEEFQKLLFGMRIAFLDELPERCDDFEEQVLALEKTAGDREVFNALYRSVHSVKGSGGTHGLAVITTLCHQLENLLTEAATSGSFGETFTNRALAYVDLLRRIVPLGRQLDTDFSTIEKELDALHLRVLQQRKSGLIAESSAMMSRIYQAALADQPLKLTVVDDGLSALERLMHETYDFAIIGRELKELNGIAVVSALRASMGKNQGMPVILITSNRDHIPAHLRLDTILPRNQQLSSALRDALQPLLT